MILFLDFDGVLHPVPRPGEGLRYRGELFCFLPMLAEALQPHPEVQIIVSSTWRHEYTMEELRTMLGDPLGPRIIGTTGRGNFGSRYQEIRAAAYKRGEWLALEDDIKGWAAKDRHRLVACHRYVGLGEAGKIEELAAKLSEILGRRGAQRG